MDEFKPEDELKPDPSDRRTGRSRKSSEYDNEPQLNIDDVDLDADDRRPTRARRARDEEAEYEAEEELADDADVERRPRKRKKAPAKGPVSRQHIMMGVGILVLLLLIIGIGSALKAPSSDSTTAQNQPAEKSVNLNGGDNSAANQANGTQPAPGATSAENPSNGQDISLPPVSSTPTQGQVTAAPEGQQRVEVQGDLNNALTAQQGQIDAVVTNSTLPTEPATVASTGSHASRQAASNEAQPARTERKQAVIEPAPRKTQATQTAPARQPAAPKATETKPTATVKQTAPAANSGSASAPVKAPTATATAPKATTSAPAATATASAPAASAGASSGNVGSLKSAPSSHYTLQLSSSSNYNNLNAWAKKESLKNYVVYQTTRNGQPWYVLVSGVYASKEDAKRAVSTLPADVQAKNPWAKPIHQVQADLK
ncbi:cell division protein DamX [Atlantibacter subterraneus]|uniref:cell division protein DamX n=1 Tax=Atlantibacter subterraneus TaxID=255519 RepID=UPI002964E6E6|nr:cell division protein DamX [Atlantibacter subterranea]MDW2744018.1 cell division protein DamX [Atlantibacter subterranea]